MRLIVPGPIVVGVVRAGPAAGQEPSTAADAARLVILGRPLRRSRVPAVFTPADARCGASAELMRIFENPQGRSRSSFGFGLNENVRS